jgi:hypothetical protein
MTGSPSSFEFAIITMSGRIASLSAEDPGR